LEAADARKEKSVAEDRNLNESADQRDEADDVEAHSHDTVDRSVDTVDTVDARDEGPDVEAHSHDSHDTVD
jgi:hypothetical protein